MCTEIYYFSGTGNSLFVARELSRKLIGSKLIPLVSLLDSPRIEISADTVGFVFPLHGLTLPVPVRLFLKRARFASPGYTFAVATRGGTRCFAFSKIESLMKGARKRLDAGFILTMLNNDPKFEQYDVPGNEEIDEVRVRTVDRAATIAERVAMTERAFDVDNDYIDFPWSKPVNFLMERLVLFGMFMVEHGNVNGYFRADSTCKGCSTCSQWYVHRARS
jgi:hypothetical protein